MGAVPEKRSVNVRLSAATEYRIKRLVRGAWISAYQISRRLSPHHKLLLSISLPKLPTQNSRQQKKQGEARLLCDSSLGCRVENSDSCSATVSRSSTYRSFQRQQLSSSPQPGLLGCCEPLTVAQKSVLTVQCIHRDLASFSLLLSHCSQT
jgi:hypothetical protein